MQDTSAEPARLTIQDARTRAEIRARYPGMLLLVRTSPESYQWMDEDRATVARLGVAASVSHHDLESVLRKVLRAGHRVAVCEANTNDKAREEQ